VEASDDDRQRLYGSLGRFIVEFSHLEVIIRHALIVAMGLSFDCFDVVTASYDFRTLCGVTKAFLCRFASYTEQDQSELTKLLNECMAVNDDRVRIVHGTWFVDYSGTAGVRHMSRSTFESKFYYARIEDINSVTSKVEDLKSRLAKFLIRPEAKRLTDNGL
jgi:hypothetical protein